MTRTRVRYGGGIDQPSGYATEELGRLRRSVAIFQPGALRSVERTRRASCPNWPEIQLRLDGLEARLRRLLDETSQPSLQVRDSELIRSPDPTRPYCIPQICYAFRAPETRPQERQTPALSLNSLSTVDVR